MYKCKYSTRTPDPGPLGALEVEQLLGLFFVIIILLVLVLVLADGFFVVRDCWIIDY